jgi:hypothetical protein
VATTSWRMSVARPNCCQRLQPAAALPGVERVPTTPAAGCRPEPRAGELRPLPGPTLVHHYSMTSLRLTSRAPSTSTASRATTRSNCSSILRSPSPGLLWPRDWPARRWACDT